MYLNGFGAKMASPVHHSALATVETPYLIHRSKKGATRQQMLIANDLQHFNK
jgi:hypothetical protein